MIDGTKLLVLKGKFILEQAILKVLLKAKHKKSLSTTDVSRQMGMLIKTVEGGSENSITEKLLGILEEKGKVRRCKQPKGRISRWELTKEGEKSIQMEPEKPCVILEIRNRNLNAEGEYYPDNTFIVYKNSEITKKWRSKEEERYKPLKLLHSSVINCELLVAPIGMDKVTLKIDLPFYNPSAAAAIVLGRNSSGNEEWKVKGTSITLGEWREKNGL